MAWWELTSKTWTPFYQRSRRCPGWTVTVLCLSAELRSGGRCWTFTQAPPTDLFPPIRSSNRSQAGGLRTFTRTLTVVRGPSPYTSQGSSQEPEAADTELLQILLPVRTRCSPAGLIWQTVWTVLLYHGPRVRQPPVSRPSYSTCLRFLCLWDSVISLLWSKENENHVLECGGVFVWNFWGSLGLTHEGHILPWEYLVTLYFQRPCYVSCFYYIFE